MKKFIGGIVVGYLGASFALFWAGGGVDRTQDLLNRIKQGENFPDLAGIIQYLMDGKGPYAPQPRVAEEQLEPASDEHSVRLRAQATRIKHMHVEGYSTVEIAENMGVPEEAVRIVLVFMGEMEA